MTHLKVGDVAPNFTGKNQDGKEIGSKDFAGKKIILYFYPKDMTPGCTAQACNLTENYAALLEKGYAVVGVSPDSESKHKKFIEKYNIPFDLIADEDLSVIKSFGVWGEKQMYGRKYEGVYRETFIIDEQGKIEEVITKVQTKDHSAQIIG
ncbi:MAG TPA: thioredoxin-dependent thiol peroxidase [Flavobacteriales bacterium]|jgi:peroxiredoxin Q/BCP|nr:thioredoxin-dependent thiol peroxidase [Flavobacteriales bacterium]